MGFDGNTVLVKHNGAVYKCHKCHLMKKKPSNTKPENKHVETVVLDKVEELLDVSSSCDDSDSSDDNQDLGYGADEDEDILPLSNEDDPGVKR